MERRQPLCMYDMSAFAESRNMFIIVGGDFNMTPTEFDANGILDKQGLIIVLPPISATTNVGDGRLVDFWLVSTPARPLIIDCDMYDTP